MIVVETRFLNLLEIISLYVDGWLMCIRLMLFLGCVQYRDLDHATQLACTIWEIREGRECQPLGGSTCNVFSKKGRLKSGVQLLTVWSNKKADIQQPTLTPGKVPVKERGELGYDLICTV